MVIPLILLKHKYHLLYHQDVPVAMCVTPGTLAGLGQLRRAAGPGPLRRVARGVLPKQQASQGGKVMGKPWERYGKHMAKINTHR